MKRVITGIALFAAVACGSSDQRMSDELEKDLELASSNDGLQLGGEAGVPQQLVSAVERTDPNPRRMAASQRVVRPRRVPDAPPEIVEEPEAEESDEAEPQSVEPSPVATEDAPPVAPRPRPILVSYPGGYGGGRAGGGSGVGGAIGVGIDIISAVVVIRGGGVDGDRCEEHDRARRGGMRPTVTINNRIPVIRGVPVIGTFPRY